MKDFETWKNTVLAQVRFAPDRTAIGRELTGHFEDSLADFKRIGYDSDLAYERALQSLGEPEEIGKALNQAHKPFWGYLLGLSWGVVALAVLLVLLNLGGYRLYGIQSWLNQEPIVDNASGYGTPLPLPMDFTAGDYRYEFQEAWYALEPYGDSLRGSVWVTMNAHSPAFYLGAPEMYDQVEAVDDRGRVYESNRFPYTEGYSTDGLVRPCGVCVFLDGYLPEKLEIRHKTAGWSFTIEIPQEGGVS